MFGNKNRSGALRKDTSWQGVSKWYGEIVGDKGHFYHQSVIMPLGLKLLDLKKESRLLDIACGQGVVARNIESSVEYLGVDLSLDLVREAQRRDKNPKHKYLMADVVREIPTKEKFDRASIILALQNIKFPAETIKNISKHLVSGARFLIVLNHPAFRIPRQSSWEIDEKNKLQFRRINKYLSPMEIPINAHPGEKDSRITWSYHHSIEDYSKYLFESGFLIEQIQEWTSGKQSEGKAARMENRARDEFPLFMAILAVKK